MPDTDDELKPFEISIVTGDPATTHTIHGEYYSKAKTAKEAGEEAVEHIVKQVGSRRFDRIDGER